MKNIGGFIFYKKREKITWITEDLGFDKNINKIELENDFPVNLKDEALVSLYGGSNNNTSYSYEGKSDRYTAYQSHLTARQKEIKQDR